MMCMSSQNSAAFWANKDNTSKNPHYSKTNYKLDDGRGEAVDAKLREKLKKRKHLSPKLFNSKHTGILATLNISRRFHFALRLFQGKECSDQKIIIRQTFLK